MKKMVIHAMVFMFILSACESRAEPATIESTFEDIVSQLKIDLNGEIELFDQVDLKDTKDPAAMMYLDVFDIDHDLIYEGYAIKSLLNKQAADIIVIQANDKAEIHTIKSGLNNYFEQQMVIGHGRDAEGDLNKDNHRITTQDDTIIYITYNAPEKIEDIFLNYN